MSLFNRYILKRKENSTCKKIKTEFYLFYFMIDLLKNNPTRIAISSQTSEVVVRVLQTCVHLTKKGNTKAAGRISMYSFFFSWICSQRINKVPSEARKTISTIA